MSAGPGEGKMMSLLRSMIDRTYNRMASIGGMVRPVAYTGRKTANAGQLALTQKGQR